MFFDAISLQLKEWIENTATETDVGLDPPDKHHNGSDIPHTNLYLFELKRPESMSVHDREKMQVLLRYLVSTSASSAIESHQLLGKLFIAASQTSLFDISLEAMPYSFWHGLKTPPRPSFIIEMLYTQTLSQQESPVIKEPLIIQTQINPPKSQAL